VGGRADDDSPRPGQCVLVHPVSMHEDSTAWQWRSGMCVARVPSLVFVNFE